MSHKDDLLRAAVEDAIRHAIRLPNKQFAYSRCNICDASWWDTEEHRLGCAVPRWKLALASRLREAADSVCVPREPTLRWLQNNLPWTVAYSKEFENSALWNARRRTTHDVLHVMKSLGRIAAECEASDHGTTKGLTGNALAKEVADLVICALHIAKLHGFNLQDAVIDNSGSRNGVDLRAMLSAAPGGEDE